MCVSALVVDLIQQEEDPTEMRQQQKSLAPKLYSLSVHFCIDRRNHFGTSPSFYVSSFMFFYYFPFFFFFFSHCFSIFVASLSLSNDLNTQGAHM